MLKIQPKAGTVVYRRLEQENTYSSIIITAGLDRYDNPKAEIIGVGHIRKDDGTFMEHPDIKPGMVAHISVVDDREELDIDGQKLYSTSFENIWAIYDPEENE